MKRYLVEVPFVEKANGHLRTDYRYFAVYARGEGSARKKVLRGLEGEFVAARCTARAVADGEETRLQALIAGAKARLPRLEEKAEAPNSTLADCARVMMLYRNIEENEKQLAALVACR